MVVGGGGRNPSDVKMGCTIYWKIFSPFHTSRGVYGPYFCNLLCNSHINYKL